MRTGNMPPGLKKYWQSHGRKSGHSKKRKHSGGSTALVRYVPSAPVVRTRTRTIVKTVRKGGGGQSVMRREHGAGEMMPGPFRLKSGAIAGLVGYSESGKGFTALQEFMGKLPTIGKLPKEAIAGVLANYFGDRSEWIDAAAQALIDIAGYKLGQAGFAISGDDD